MSLTTFFSRPIKVYYKSSNLSQASIFWLFSTFLNILFPWIIVYNTDGIWKRTQTFQAQPIIHFNYQMILIAELNSSKIFWSTFPEIKALLDQRFIRVPFINIYEVDNYLDGKYDECNVKIMIPLKEDENIHKINLLLFYHYQLREMDFSIDSLIHIQSETHKPSFALSVIGDVILHQNIPLQKNYMNTEDFKILDNFNIDMILKRNQHKDFSLVLDNSIYNWYSGKDDENDFYIELKLSYLPQVFRYKSNLWFIFKWAWIQYLSLFVIFYWINKNIKSFVFKNQLISTVVRFELPKSTPNILM